MKWLFIVPSLLSLSASATNYYVKSGGMASGPGTNDQKAWSYAYFQTQSFTPADAVFFKKGDVLTGSFSATAGLYGAYGSGANPVINELLKLTAWRSIGNGKYETVLPAFPTRLLNMVLVDGKVKGMGRYPKAGQEEASYYKVASFRTTNERWTASEGVIKSENIAALPNFTGGEVVYRSSSWIFSRGKVKTQGKDFIAYDAQRALNQTTTSYTPQNNYGMFFQNHPNCLATLGDWCYDSTTHKITMYFGRDNPSSHTIQVAAYDSLLYINEKNNVTIQGINFIGANEKGVVINHSINTRILGATINYSGIYGIDQSANIMGTTVDGCIISNALSNGINGSHSPKWSIRNNHIKNIGTITGMGQSGDNQYIGIDRTDSLTIIEKNEIDSIGYSAIYFIGKDTIRFNHIHDFCLTKSDGGGIYTFGNTGTGRYIYRNIVHDGYGDLYGLNQSANPGTNEYKGNVHGIYIDDNAAAIQVVENTVFNHSMSGIFLHDAASIMVRNNTCYNNLITQLFMLSNGAGFKNIVVKNNVFMAARTGSVAMAFNVPKGLTTVLLDSNIISRPTNDPGKIDKALGYITSAFDSWNQGGVVAYYYGNPTVFFSLDKWQSFSGQDVHSIKTSVPVTDKSNIRLDYNVTQSNISIKLDKPYISPTGNPVSGTIILKPFTSSLLLYNLESVPDLRR